MDLTSTLTDLGKSRPTAQPTLEARVKYYNDFLDLKNQQTLKVRSTQEGDDLLLEGQLRVYWGVNCPIHFKKKDDNTPAPKEWRRSYCLAVQNGLDDSLLNKIDNQGQTLRGHAESLEDMVSSLDIEPTQNEATERKYGTVGMRNVARRRIRRSKRRWSMINGHVYNVDTSVFVPTHDSVTSVRICSLDPTHDVIKLLLDKFKVVNNPADFCLCVVKSTGETRVLKDNDFPLIERVIQGPVEDVAKIFIVDREHVVEVCEQVAQYLNLPEAVLKGFIEKYNQEETLSVHQLKSKYRTAKYEIRKRLEQFASTHM